MKCFPQLTTGSIAQYPLTKTIRRRTVETVTIEGRNQSLADDAASEIEWELQLAGLTTSESNRLVGLFKECEGRLNTFTFLDPVGNLLSESGDVLSTVWQRGPGLMIVPLSNGPWSIESGVRITNTAQGTQAISQALDVPGGYQYCFSFYASAPAPETVTITQSSGVASQSVESKVGTNWNRVVVPGRLSSSVDSVTFGISIEPGATVLLDGLQVEAQIQPSPYRRTFSKGGVFPVARFVDDVLTVRATGPDRYSCTVRVRTAGVS